MLLLGGRAPHKILFAKDTGRVQQAELVPVYNERGGLERLETVPFRLTRNMYTFFTSFGVEGVFVTAMANGAQALLHKGGNAQHVLAIVFRDDISAWSARRGPAKQSLASNLKPDTLKTLVASNTRKTLERVRAVAPLVGEDGAALAHQLLVQPELRSSVGAGAQEVVEAAMNPKNLCRMEPAWHPWF